MAIDYHVSSAAVTTEPLVVEDVKRYLVIEHNFHDDDVKRWISAARAAVEAHTGLTVANRVLTLYRSGFPAGRTPLVLPTSPVNSITSINYLDTSESSQSYTTFTLRNSHLPELIPDTATNWPSVSHYHNDAVTIVLDAGYTAALCPAGIKNAMLCWCAATFENRGDVNYSLNSAFFDFLAPHCLGIEFTNFGR